MLHHKSLAVDLVGRSEVKNPSDWVEFYFEPWSFSKDKFASSPVNVSQTKHPWYQTKSTSFESYEMSLDFLKLALIDEAFFI